MKKKLIIINKWSFGYHTDSYKWCEYLKDCYDITFICFDSEPKRMSMPGVEVKYVKYSGSRRTRGFRYVAYCIWYMLWHHAPTIISHFDHCEILRRLFPFRKLLLDIRTLSISPNEVVRKQKQIDMVKSCKYFKHISAISEGVINKLNLSGKKVNLLRLGADVISKTPKRYDKLRLLYVGTFNNRHLNKVLIGIAIFRKEHPNVPISVDFVGSGELEGSEQLCDIAADLEINDIVKFHGHIPYDELEPFFSRNNIGISFVPITDYYEYQPPTKTFEYAMSGLFTIATRTFANREIITPDNGILIKDTPYAFADALTKLSNGGLQQINEHKVRESLKDMQWSNIVENELKPILKKIQ